MLIFKKIDESRTSMIIAGIGTVLISASLGAYFFPREVSNIGIYDKNLDGNVDLIEERNLRITFTNDIKYLTLESLPYKICYFSTNIPMKNIETELAQMVRPILEDCFKE